MGGRGPVPRHCAHGLEREVLRVCLEGTTRSARCIVLAGTVGAPIRPERGLDTPVVRDLDATGVAAERRTGAPAISFLRPPEPAPSLPMPSNHAPFSIAPAQPPITYRDHQDRVWSVSNAAVIG